MRQSLCIANPSLLNTMIKINDHPVVKSKTNSGEVILDNVQDIIHETLINDHPRIVINMTWESNEDLAVLQLVRMAILDIQYYRTITCDLKIGYFPYHRFDAEARNTSFTLKYVAKIINNLNFNMVYVEDPHSDVLPALLDRVICHYSALYKAVSEVYYSNTSVLVFMNPSDMRKYGRIVNSDAKMFGIKSSLADLPYTYYDFPADGTLSGDSTLKLPTPEFLKGKRAVLVVNTADKGTHIERVAAAAKAAGADQVVAHISHVLPTAEHFWRTNGNNVLDKVTVVDTLDIIRKFDPKDTSPC